MVAWTKETLEGKKQAELRIIAETLGLDFDGKTTCKQLRKLILGYYGTSAKKPGKKVEAVKDSGKDSAKRPTEKLQEAPSWPSSVKVSASEFRVWRREVDTWVRVSTEQGHSEDTMFVAFMRQHPHSVKEQVYAELDAGAEHVESVLEILSRDHGGLEAVNSQKQLTEYRNLRRKKDESLSDFLTRYRQLRAKVVNAGQVVAQAADVTDLLLACGLDTAQHSAILSNLRREKGLKTPESQLQFVLDELKALEEMYALLEDQGSERTPEHVTLFADQPKGPKGKGSWWPQPGDWKGGGKGRKGRDGKGKAKGKAKKGKHDKGAGHGTGLGKGGKALCWAWSGTGTCKFGDECKFSHESGTAVDKRKAEGDEPPAKRFKRK